MVTSLVPPLPRVRAVAGRLPAGTASVAAVVAATAFHWFASEEVLAEFARILRPLGVVALVWNVRDETVPWVRNHTAIVEPHAGTAPRYVSMDWDRVVRSSPQFVREDEHRAPNPVPMDREGLVHRILSTSFIAALADDARDEVAAAARRLAAGLPETFEYPYETRTVLLRRT